MYREEKIPDLHYKIIYGLDHKYNYLHENRIEVVNIDQ